MPLEQSFESLDEKYEETTEVKIVTGKEIMTNKRKYFPEQNNELRKKMD